jgi:transposase
MYPSDLKNAQWAMLQPILREALPQRHGGGRPRKYSVRRVVNALLYVVKTGCQWRQLPKNFPPWKAVHEQFRRWRDDGVWEQVSQRLRQTGRLAQGRKAEPSLAVLDSQSVKTALKGGRGATTRARRSRAVSGTSRSIRKAIC